MDNANEYKAIMIQKQQHKSTRYAAIELVLDSLERLGDGYALIDGQLLHWSTVNEELTRLIGNIQNLPIEKNAE